MLCPACSSGPKVSKRHMLRWTCDCGRLRAESMILSGVQ